MDRFTRNYLIALGVILTAVAALWIASNWDPGASRINEVLESDPELAGYPYQFRVEALDDGVALLKSPRSFDVPVSRFLAVIDPRLAGRPDDDSAMMAAQAELVRHQKRAQALVEAQPEVTRVRWVLDRAWWAERGLPLP
jgi:hypothetical protein